MIVVDECSMVPRYMVKQLARYPVYYIFLGDPAQIPPIYSKDWNGLLDAPHIFLDQIMRQAAESEIIQLTMAIREGRRLKEYNGEDIKIMPKSKLNEGILMWGDIVLVATNKQRKHTNDEVRRLLGYTDLDVLHEGEKLICLENYWDNYSDTDYPLMNGTIGYANNIYDNHFHFHPRFGFENNQIDILSAEFTSDIGDYFGGFDMEKYTIFNGESAITNAQRYKLGQDKIYQKLIPYEFSLGYAITGHKAQGSEWEKVVVIEEDFPRVKKEHQQWLYTCCTRPSQKLVLLTNN